MSESSGGFLLTTFKTLGEVGALLLISYRKGSSGRGRSIEGLSKDFMKWWDISGLSDSMHAELLRGPFLRTSLLIVVERAYNSSLSKGVVVWMFLLHLLSPDRSGSSEAIQARSLRNAASVTLLPCECQASEL